MFNIFNRKTERLDELSTVQIVIFRIDNNIGCKVFKEPESCLDFANKLRISSEHQDISVIRIEEYKIY